MSHKKSGRLFWTVLAALALCGCDISTSKLNQENDSNPHLMPAPIELNLKPVPRGPTVDIGKGSEIFISAAPNENKILVVFKPLTFPVDLGATVPEQYRIYRVNGNSLVMLNSGALTDINKGVAQIVFSPYRIDFRVIGKRMLSGTIQSGEVRLGINGVPKLFNGSMSDPLIEYYGSSSINQDIYILDNKNSGFQIGLVDAGGVRETPFEITNQTKDGCMEGPVMWTENNNTFVGFVGKRITNNGQKDLLKGILTRYDVVNRRFTLSSEIDFALGAEMLRGPVLLCTNFGYELLAAYPEMGNSRLSSIVWKSSGPALSTLKANITSWGGNGRPSTVPIERDVEMVVPHSTDRWAAVAVEYAPWMTNFLVIKKNGKLESQVTLTKDNVGPVLPPQSERQKNVAMANVGNNLFLVGWVTANYDVRIQLVSIVN